jgi:hypothetical protein
MPVVKEEKIVKFTKLFPCKLILDILDLPEQVELICPRFFDYNKA